MLVVILSWFYIRYIFFYMKQFKVVALSSKNNLLVLDPQGQSYEYPLEGFRVLPSLSSRPLLQDLIGKNIECTLNKTGTHIRYQNQAFFTQKIEAGAIQVVAKELDQTRIYNAEQKARLSKCQKKAQQKEIGIVDLTSNRKDMLKLFSRGGEIKGNIEWLGQEMVVSTLIDGKLTFLPLRLRNINTLFDCLPESTFVSFIQQFSKITVNLQRPIYNLIKKRFELTGSLNSEIEIRILSEGWGTINTAALAKLGGTDYSAYLKAQNEAKDAHKGVFSRNCEILAFIYAKNNFVGEISDVFDGYIFEVTKKTGGKIKLELAMVRCPVGDEPGAFNCREFSRKQLIGQQVNVYLHKDSGLNITGSLIRAKDSKDVEAMLVQQGWGFVRQEFINSVLCIKLNELERRSKEKLRGLFSKDLGVHRPEDLTLPNTHKEDIYYDRRNHILKSVNDNQAGVLEGIVDLLTYRVWLQDKNALLRVKLQGVQGHNINPLLEEVKKMKEDHKELYETKLKKRSVQVTITSYNKDTNSFIGTITFVGGKSLQEIVLEESLVYSQREGNAPENYKAIEKRVRDLGKGLWSPNLINFQPIDPLQLQNQKFNGKFSWVEDGQTVYIQPETNYKTLDMIASKLRSKQLKKVTKQQIVNGSLVAAPYFQEFYRALIISVKGKKIKVIFIDWGNKQTVEEGDLRQLPEQLRFIEKQSIKTKLYLTKPIKNEQYLERVRGELMDGNEYNFKKEANGCVQAYRNKQNIVLSLIERGIVKGNTEQATPSMREKILAFERLLKESRIGVWEWSDEEEMSEHSEND